jgi:hypothetical protein
MSIFNIKRPKIVEDLIAEATAIIGSKAQASQKSKDVHEDSVAPGVAYQVPASIGGMGNPVAPTQTSIGSGDNFNPKRKKRNKRVLEFNDFIENSLK